MQDLGEKGTAGRIAQLEHRISEYERAEQVQQKLWALDQELASAALLRLPLREMLQHCAGALVKHLDAALARIWTLNEKENVLELQASAGLYTHIDGPHGRVPVGKYKIGLIAEERRPHLTNTVIGDPRVHDQEWAKREGMVAFAGYPLLIENRLMGVGAMFARAPLSERVLEGLASVAYRIALAIESRRAEEAVERSERRFRALTEKSEDAITMVAADGTIRYATPSSIRILGFSPEEFSTILGFAMVHPDDQARVRSKLAAVLEKPGSIIELEVRIRRKSGEWAWIEGTVRNLLDDPDVEAIVANYRDISERKGVEQKLLQSQKLESLGVLAGGIAHDFNNLLVGILGNASLALETLPPGSAARPMLEELVRTSERAGHLTRQLLAYAGKGRFLVEPIDLSALVREIGNLLRVSIPKNVQLRLELAEDLPAVEADVGQMQQLVMNLVINGAEAIGDQAGTVLVSTAAQLIDEPYIKSTFAPEEISPGDYVALEVHDSGIGMTEEVKARIFDPFYSTKFVGRGLGLAAALGIVRGHKGAIKVYSRPGQGTSFKILFPASEAGVRKDRETGVEAGLHGTGTILVVDDEEVVQRMARSILERYGYQVVVAGNGREAIELYKRMHDQISMVLLDLTMPELGGRETLRELHLIRSDVPVLLSSGYNEIEAVRHFAGKGLAGFIQKPYQVLHLAKKVRDILGGGTS